MDFRRWGGVVPRGILVLGNGVSGIWRANQRGLMPYFYLGSLTALPRPPLDPPQKYPQNEYPDDRAVSENQKRTKQEQEFELANTGEGDYNEKLLNQLVPVTKIR